MNHKIVKFSAFLVICLLFAGFAVASSTTESNNDNVIISSDGAPNVSAIAPAEGKLGEIVAFTLTGAGFSKNVKVYLDNGNAKDPKDIIANEVNVTSSSSLTGSFNIPDSSKAGTWNVTIKETGKITPSNVKFTITK